MRLLVPEKKTKTTKKKATEKLIQKPTVDDGNFTIVLSVDEMFSLVQILGFSKEIFERMALNYDKDGQLESAKVYAARSELSMILFKKFRAVAGIGEPTSRDVH